MRSLVASVPQRTSCKAWDIMGHGKTNSVLAFVHMSQRIIHSAGCPPMVISALRLLIKNGQRQQCCSVCTAPVSKPLSTPNEKCRLNNCVHSSFCVGNLCKCAKNEERRYSSCLFSSASPSWRNVKSATVLCRNSPFSLAHCGKPLLTLPVYPFTRQLCTLACCRAQKHLLDSSGKQFYSKNALDVATAEGIVASRRRTPIKEDAEQVSKKFCCSKVFVKLRNPKSCPKEQINISMFEVSLFQRRPLYSWLLLTLTVDVKSGFIAYTDIESTVKFVLTVICVMRPLCFCPSAAHFL
jgi:hypothetical protein